MDEMDRLPVDLGHEVREAVERLLMLPPVVFGFPLLGQFGDELDGLAA